MVDNIAVTPGTGATIGADDISGVLHQRVKPTWGPDGTANDVDIATGKPLPVQVRSATGLIPLGEPTDAKATATDTTSVSAISIWKQISASIQAAASSLAGSLTVATHAVTQSGVWNVTNVSGTVSLPTGAATLAKQPALGTAGTASTDVITVQGIASGTALSAAQSGTWNVTNVSGTVSLPTGAATVAKQPALGTAGSASTDVITVQGIASGTAQPASQSGTWNVTNISGTVSLPTGAATLAKQPALGTAGSASTDVITVQGIASGTALSTKTGSLTLVTLTVKTVTTGGTAVTALTAGQRAAGGWIKNPETATVNLGINEIGTAAGTSSSGDTTFIVPGDVYTLAPSGNAVSVISSDSTHPFSGMGYT